MNDLELPMLSYYVIYYEMIRKVMQRTEKEAFRTLNHFYCTDICDKPRRGLAMLIYIYLNVDEC